MSAKILAMGIDGCKKGWIAAYYNKKNELSFKIFSMIKNVYSFSELQNINRIFIDIPIGIPKSQNYPRICDIHAKKLLKSRRSTIFLPPCREALYASNYREGLEIQRNLIGKGFSIQAWNICSKIREVDQFLNKHENSKIDLLESHPELCFYGFNSNQPIKASKHTQDGIELRKNILLRIEEITESKWEEIVQQFPKNYAKIDDLLDSWILLKSASLSNSFIKRIPKKAVFDSLNNPMHIYYPNFN